MLRALALLPYPTGRVPGQRYRIEQWAPRMRDCGVEVTFSPFLSASAMEVLYERGRYFYKVRETLRGYLKRIRELRRLEGFAVAYVFRETTLLGASWFERQLASRLPIVYDFDDAIYLPASSDAHPGLQWVKDRRKAAKICGLARHVTVGNATLASFARRHASAVTVIPSTIDTEEYVVRSRPPNQRLVVGWTGSQTTAPYLRLLHEPLRRLREVVDFELVVIGARVEMPGLAVRSLPWRAESEVEDLRRLDVGLMPLPDDEWSRGKCGMKALQYMGLGIPPVVSPVGANAEIVADGVNGFHARTADEWVDRVARLLHDPGRRAALGTAARRTVEERYSASVHAPRMCDVLRAAAGQPHPDSEGVLRGR